MIPHHTRARTCTHVVEGWGGSNQGSMRRGGGVESATGPQKPVHTKPATASPSEGARGHTFPLGFGLCFGLCFGLGLGPGMRLR